MSDIQVRDGVVYNIMIGDLSLKVMFINSDCQVDIISNHQEFLPWMMSAFDQIAATISQAWDKSGMYVAYQVAEKLTYPAGTRQQLMEIFLLYFGVEMED